MRFWLVIVLAAACDPHIRVRHRVVCRTPEQRTAAQASFSACTSAGQPRSLHVDDDTVDMAEWVRSCGEQAREIACDESAFAECFLNCAIIGGESIVNCRSPKLPKWAEKACEGSR